MPWRLVIGSWYWEQKSAPLPQSCHWSAPTGQPGPCGGATLSPGGEGWVSSPRGHKFMASLARVPWLPQPCAAPCVHVFVEEAALPGVLGTPGAVSGRGSHWGLSGKQGIMRRPRDWCLAGMDPTPSQPWPMVPGTAFLFLGSWPTWLVPVSFCLEVRFLRPTRSPARLPSLELAPLPTGPASPSWTQGAHSPGLSCPPALQRCAGSWVSNCAAWSCRASCGGSCCRSWLSS